MLVVNGEWPPGLGHLGVILGSSWAHPGVMEDLILILMCKNLGIEEFELCWWWVASRILVSGLSFLAVYTEAFGLGRDNKDTLNIVNIKFLPHP